MRRLALSARHLGPNSRLRKHLGGELATWSQSEHFQADQIDLLNRLVWLNYAIAQANGIKAKDLKNPPERMPRPGDELQKPKIRFGTKADIQNALKSAIAGG